MALTNFLNSLTDAATITEADDNLRKILADYGYNKFSYNYYPIDFQRNKKAKHILCAELTQDWQTYYVDKNYDQIDPILKRMHQTSLPFGWKLEDELGQYGQHQDRLFSDAIEFGLWGGFAVPVHSPTGEFANLVIQDVAILHDIKETPLLKHDLHLIATYYHNKISELVSTTDFSIQLTARETECLYLTSQHKTAKEIAKTLNISPRTVGFHIENTIKKFNVKNKHQAVDFALHQGMFR